MDATYKKLAKQLKEERERLVKGLEQLRVGASKSGDNREGSPFGKKEDEATETTEFEKRLALETKLQGLLDGVDQALAKVKDGTYGTCDACGQPIDIERLEALPQARLCLNCKTQEAKIAKSRFPSG
jgi:DnaK suppressor protein